MVIAALYNIASVLLIVLSLAHLFREEHGKAAAFMAFQISMTLGVYLPKILAAVS